jgi:Mn2+/Fe2+ NRAMP family transporter
MHQLAIALLLAATALAAAIVRGWAGVTLMSDYKIDEYLATPRARRLYWTGVAMPFVIVGAIVGLASMTGLWWVMLPACLLAAFVVWKTSWALHMRFSGKYRDFYRAMHWR